MDLFELKKEQLRLASKVIIRDGFDKIKTIGGVDCVQVGNNILTCVIVCEYPSLKVLESKFYTLTDPLPYKPGFQAYREMAAVVEAFNQLEQEPDLLLVRPDYGIQYHMGNRSEAMLTLDAANADLKD